jgi:hypothetical protein
MNGMGEGAALRLEYAIIALGIFALLMIFQPFSLTLFAVGSGLVVLAGLINNLLPLARADVPLRSIVTTTMVVAMIFCIVLLVAIVAAYLFGLFFLEPPNANTLSGKAQLAARPFYLHPFVWSVAAIAAALAALITFRNRNEV